jgi:hypothetical protein
MYRSTGTVPITFPLAAPAALFKITRSVAGLFAALLALMMLAVRLFGISIPVGNKEQYHTAQNGKQSFHRSSSAH